MLLFVKSLGSYSYRSSSWSWTCQLKWASSKVSLADQAGLLQAAVSADKRRYSGSGSLGVLESLYPEDNPGQSLFIRAA